jgi:D-glycero-D-manno-heptose 1,7-bisphosphate phosphatase
VLLTGAAAAVRRLNEAGVRTILVTNQRWMSMPGAEVADFAATQDRLAELLAAEGAWLDAVYHCPHARGECVCRKPAPGMMRRAADDFDLSLAYSVIVGDAASDIEAGRACGMGTVLLAPVVTDRRLADAVVSDLASAVDLLLE